MSKQIVIARYCENVDWVQELKQDYIIYDKTPNATPSQHTIILQNHIRGREAHTILHHIINNYHQLADQTTFLQGNPYPHFLTKYSSMMEDLNSNYSTLFRPNGIIKVSTPTDYRMSQMELLIKECMPNIDNVGKKIAFVIAAQFTVHKDIIQLKPLEFYKQIYDMIIENKIDAHTMELVWCQYIFAPTNNYYKSQYWKEIREYADHSIKQFWNTANE